MPEMIRDGKGTGKLLQIDNKNRIRGYVVIEDESAWINRVEAESYSAMLSSTGIVAASGGCFIGYIKNNSSKDLVIVRVKHRCEDADGSLSFWLNVEGTPSGVLTTSIPSNRNAGSNNESECDYYTSTNITGLSGGRKVGSIFSKSGEEFEFGEPCSGYILPFNSTFALKANNNTAKHFGGISIYFRDSVSY